MPKIIQNALYCPICRTYIRSVSVHDYRTCKCATEQQQCMVDGGLEYIRTSINKHQIEFHLYADDHISKIAEKMLWGTYGKDGKQPFKLVLLKECSINHLEVILKDIPNLNKNIKNVIKYLLALNKEQK